MQEVSALCDRVVLIAKGTVVADGTPDSLRAETGCENLEDAYVALAGGQAAEASP
jgi:sodium transport system ATP-binding protein